MSGALEGLVVADRSETIAGQFCGKLLADFGAEVWLAEAGPARPGIASGGAGDGMTPLHLHLNLGKRRGMPPLAPDVVLCAPDEDPATVRDLNPSALAVRITGFGDDGPKAGWDAPELVLQASSGMMISNGIRGREPLYGTGNRASCAAGQAAYIQILASLRARRQTGRGDTIRIDAAETAAAMSFPYVLQAIYNGTDRRRGDQDIPAGQVLCRGSWVCLWVYSNRFAALCRALGLEASLIDPRFAEVPVRQKNWPAFFDLVQSEVADRDPDAFVAELQAMNIIAARAYRISELRASRHLQARGYWRRVPDRRRGPRAARPAVPDEPDAGARAAGEGRCCRLKASGSSSSPPRGPDRWPAGCWPGTAPRHSTSRARRAPTPGARTATGRTRSATPTSTPASVLGPRLHVQLAERQQALAGRGPQEPTGLLSGPAPGRDPDVLICNFRPGTARTPRARPCALSREQPGLIVVEMPAYRPRRPGRRLCRARADDGDGGRNVGDDRLPGRQADGHRSLLHGPDRRLQRRRGDPDGAPPPRPDGPRATYRDGAGRGGDAVHRRRS